MFESFSFPEFDRINAETKGVVDAQAAATHAKNILGNLTTGAGLGMGGMALYHLAQALRGTSRKERKAQKYQNLATGVPQVAADAPDEEKVSNAGVGAAISQAPEQISNALTGALSGLFTGATGGEGFKDPNIIRGAIATTLGLGAGAAGLYGGSKLINSIAESKKKQDAEDAVEEARQSYYAALTGKQSSALDKVYVQFEKRAIPEMLDTALRGVLTANMLATLGAGALGARYMYNRTADRARGENLAKAQASRARMKGLPSVWVDPEQVARIKQLAEQSNNE